jgi:hypothetical protein
MSVRADFDEITPKWLTAVLHEAGALDQARVTSIQSAPIGRLGFFGQIPRLRISYDKLEPGAPRSLVAKFSAPNPEARAMAHSMGFYEREIGFIASSPPTARSVPLGFISAKSRWTAVHRYCCLRTSAGCTT